VARTRPALDRKIVERYIRARWDHEDTVTYGQMTKLPFIAVINAYFASRPDQLLVQRTDL
jgi:hypothetical protein